MTHEQRKFLADILVAVSNTEQFVQSIKSFSEYTVDLKTKSAVERQLAIIGEAVNRLSKLDVTITHAKKIVSVRNRLIHAYDSVDDEMVWVILKRHLTPLREEVKKLIS